MLEKKEEFILYLEQGKLKDNYAILIFENTNNLNIVFSLPSSYKIHSCTCTSTPKMLRVCNHQFIQSKIWMDLALSLRGSGSTI